MPTVVVTLRRLHLGANGLALPGVVFLRAGEGEGVLRHELVHQQQFKRYGVFGVAIRLGAHYGLGFLRGRRATGRWPSFLSLWSTNPLEQEANERMTEQTPLPPVVHLGAGRRLLP